MSAQVIPMPRGGSGSQIQQIAGLVRSGGVIVYPTDTIYGLGCDPFRRESIERIFSIKHRPAASPALLLVDDQAMLHDLVREIPPAAQKLIERHWPGPLTLVLNARRSIHPFVTPADGSIAVRLPASDCCRRLIGACGVPLVSTSANITGESPPIRVRELQDQFSSTVDVIVDAGDLTVSLPSTVVDVREGKIVVLREGAIRKEQLSI